MRSCPGLAWHVHGTPSPPPMRPHIGGVLACGRRKRALQSRGAEHEPRLHTNWRLAMAVRQVHLAATRAIGCPSAVAAATERCSRRFRRRGRGCFGRLVERETSAALPGASGTCIVKHSCAITYWHGLRGGHCQGGEAIALGRAERARSCTQCVAWCKHPVRVWSIGEEAIVPPPRNFEECHGIGLVGGRRHHEASRRGTRRSASGARGRSAGRPQVLPSSALARAGLSRCSFPERPQTKRMPQVRPWVGERSTWRVGWGRKHGAEVRMGGRPKATFGPTMTKLGGGFRRHLSGRMVGRARPIWGAESSAKLGPCSADAGQSCASAEFGQVWTEFLQVRPGPSSTSFAALGQAWADFGRANFGPSSAEFGPSSTHLLIQRMSESSSQSPHLGEFWCHRMRRSRTSRSRAGGAYRRRAKHGPGRRRTLSCGSASSDARGTDARQNPGLARLGAG